MARSIMSDIEEKNAIITHASITGADHGVLSAWLTLDYGGSGQNFGGYCLYKPISHFEPHGNYAGFFIWKCMEIAGVDEWSKMVGKTVRVKCEWTKVHAIGHIVKDIWFNPSEEFKER
jgi:hypothetical protein